MIYVQSNSLFLFFLAYQIGMRIMLGLAMVRLYLHVNLWALGWSTT